MVAIPTESWVLLRNTYPQIAPTIFYATLVVVAGFLPIAAAIWTACEDSAMKAIDRRSG
jgi:hypothetical protein